MSVLLLVVPATQQAPIYRPDRSQQDEQTDLGETLQDLDDEKQEEKDRSRSAGTPFSEEHDGQSVKHQLEPLVDVPESGSTCLKLQLQEQLERSDSFGHTSLKRKNFQQNLHQLRLQMSKEDEETHQG